MARVRLEFFIPAFGNSGLPRSLVGATAEASVSALATSGASRPIVPSSADTVYTRVVALDGPIYVAWGADPNASVTTGVRVDPGHPADLPTSAGQLLSFVAATPDAAGDGNVTLVAGENHVGEVSGNGIDIAPAVTVQAAAYAAGNCIGGLLTLPNLLRVAGSTAMLGSAMLKCKIANTVEIDALIFRASPTASTFTDKVAAVLAAADVGKVVRVIQFNSWVSPIGTPSFSQVDAINRLISLSSGVDGQAALIAKGVITFSSTSDLMFALNAHRN